MVSDATLTDASSGRDELDKLLTMVSFTMISGWPVGEDLYDIPTHTGTYCRLIITLVIQISFQASEDVARWMEEMIANIGLQATAYSLRSFVAPASGSA